MKPIYIESDEEITSIVDKLTSVKDKKVVVVLPKNSALLQSLISLRLLVKEAKKHQKEVVIVTDSKVGSRLARQVGLETHASLDRLPAESEAATAPTTVEQKPPAAPAPAAVLPGGVRVHQYLGERAPLDELADELDDSAQSPVEEEPSEEVNEPEPKETEENVSPPSKDDVEPTTTAESSPDLPPIVPRSITVGAAEEHDFHIPWRALVVAVILLLISAVLVTLFLPKALVKLTVPAEPTSQSLVLTAGLADTTADTNIPGSALTVTKDLTVAITATGKKDIGTKATGKVLITNKYKDNSGAGKDQSFAAGTKLTDSKTQKVFLLDTAASVGKITYNPNTGAPIYQSVTVGVTASDPGESFNLATASFNLAGALANTSVDLQGSLTGGLTKTVTVLTQDDVNKAVDAAKQQAATDAAAEIKTKAGTQTLLEGASWQTVTKQTADKEVGSQVASATAMLSIEVGAVVFEEKAAKDKLDAALRKGLKPDQDLATPEDKQSKLVVKALASDKKSLTLTISGEAFIVPKLAKSDIARSIARRSVAQAQDILKTTYSASEADISISPSWWPRRLPILSQAIVVEYGFNAISGN